MKKHGFVNYKNYVNIKLLRNICLKEYGYIYKCVHECCIYMHVCIFVYVCICIHTHVYSCVLSMCYAFFVSVFTYILVHECEHV